MSDNSNIAPIDASSATGPQLAILADKQLSEIDTDWIVEGRLNMPFVEQSLQKLTGCTSREEYGPIGTQFDMITKWVDKALIDGVDQDEVKEAIGRFAVASLAIASVAMPGAFNLEID